MDRGRGRMIMHRLATCLGLAMAALVFMGSTANAITCWGPHSSVRDFFRHADGPAVEECLRRGADPNAKGPLGSLPLYMAMAFGDKNPHAPDMVRALIAGGADLSYRDPVTGDTIAEIALSLFGADHPVTQAFNVPAAVPGVSFAEWYTGVVVGSAGENYSGRQTIYTTRSQSERDAVDRALERCESADNWWCSRFGATSGRCFSVSVGDMRHPSQRTNKQFGYGGGDTLALADQAALDYCQAGGELLNCRIWPTKLRKCVD